MLFALKIAATEIPDTVAQPLISLDFQDMDVRKALQVFAKFAKLNLIIEGSIKGKVNVHLSQVPVEEALQAILRLQGLTQQMQGNTRIISPQPIVTTDISLKKNSLLDTKRIVVQHRAAKEIGALFLENQSHKTRGSEFKIDVRSNSLWIRDTSERIQELEKLVHAFDQVVRQVLIEARIVSINRNFGRSLGMRFNLKPLAMTQTNTEESAPENDMSANASFLPLNLDLPNLSQTFNKIGPLLWAGFNRFLDLELAAMENEGHGRIISSPHLITTDRTPALIEAGSEIPYQEKGRYGTSIAFKKAALSLQVTPEMTPSEKVLLKLEMYHDKPSAPGVEQTPAIDTQKLKTQVLVKPGETVALGGIYEAMDQQSHYRVPGLGKIPLLGWLFRQKHHTHATRELLIFVTPHLVSDAVSKDPKNDVHPL